MFPVNLLNILAIQREEQLEEIRHFNIERRLMRDETDPFTLRDDMFKKTFRLTKDMANYVLNLILPDIDVGVNDMAVPSHLKFFSTLSFYATGSYQKQIGQSYNISFPSQ